MQPTHHCNFFFCDGMGGMCWAYTMQYVHFFPVRIVHWWGHQNFHCPFYQVLPSLIVFLDSMVRRWFFQFHGQEGRDTAQSIISGIGNMFSHQGTRNCRATFPKQGVYAMAYTICMSWITHSIIISYRLFLIMRLYCV